MEKQLMLHQMVIGSIGFGRKTIAFTEEQFDEKLAPACAEIERFKEKGRKYVRMTYEVSGK